MWEGIYDGFLKTPGRAQRVNRLEPDDWAPHILEDSDVVHGEATVATQADVPRMLAALLPMLRRPCMRPTNTAVGPYLRTS